MCAGMMVRLFTVIQGYHKSHDHVARPLLAKSYRVQYKRLRRRLSLQAISPCASVWVWLREVITFIKTDGMHK